MANAPLITGTLFRREMRHLLRIAIALNAGAGIYVSGVTESLASGIAAAEQAIASGAAIKKLEAFVAFTQDLPKQQGGAPAS